MRYTGWCLQALARADTLDVSGAELSSIYRSTIDMDMREVFKLAEAKKMSNREHYKMVMNRGKMPAIDMDEYPPIKGMEGPFRYRSGHILYYDPKEGKYYDRKSDMYLSNRDASKIVMEGDLDGADYNCDEACKSHGKRKRSKGKGKGLARGDGEGPIGVPTRKIKGRRDDMQEDVFMDSVEALLGLSDDEEMPIEVEPEVAVVGYMGELFEYLDECEQGADLEEAVKPGQYYVVVDISVPGGKWVDGKLYHGVAKADAIAERMNRGKQQYGPKSKGFVQVIDAKWFGPANDLMIQQGMAENLGEAYTVQDPEVYKSLKSGIKAPYVTVADGPASRMYDVEIRPDGKTKLFVDVTQFRGDSFSAMAKSRRRKNFNLKALKARGSMKEILKAINAWIAPVTEGLDESIAAVPSPMGGIMGRGGAPDIHMGMHEEEDVLWGDEKTAKHVMSSLNRNVRGIKLAYDRRSDMLIDHGMGGLVVEVWPDGAIEVYDSADPARERESYSADNLSDAIRWLKSHM